jgi:hypothetical protein
MTMIAEKYQMDFGLVTDFTGGVSAGVYSQAFDLSGVKRVTVFCGQKGTATGAAAFGSSFAVLAGVATEGPSSFASVAGLNCVLGNTTASELWGVQCIRIVAHNSYASAKTIVIDGTTYTFQANCTASDKSISCSDSSAIIKGLATVLGLFATHIETSIQTTGATNSAILLRAKGLGAGAARPGINVVVSANGTGANTLSVTPEEDLGVIQFKPEDILATNSSYTKFSVRCQGTVTVANKAFCVVIREMAYGSSYSTAKQSTLHMM